MPFVTPLRYPGGKGRLGRWLGELLRYNRISGGLFIEPYAGGAGAATYLLLEGYVNHIVINDIDPLVHAFWWTVLNDTDKLLAMIKETPVTIDTWNKLKLLTRAPNNHTKTELGFATLFLNRTNRSGILDGGVIGGKKQDGPYKLDARYNQNELCRRIQRIAARRHCIDLYQMDALELLAIYKGQLPSKALVYLDPPYYEKGSELYTNFYKPGDHARIASVIASIMSPWLVTYDDCGPIRTLYKQFPMTIFPIKYSTGIKRREANEVMFYHNVRLPREPVLIR